MSEETKKDQSSKINFLLGLFLGMAAVAIIGFFVMLGIVFNQKADGKVAAAGNDKVAAAPSVAQPTDSAPTAAAPSQSVPPVGTSDYFLGDKNAKVTMIVYTDFECPYCLNHHKTVQQVIKDYGDKVKVVIRNFPLSFHEFAQKAAESAECAGEQGKFYQMADALFQLNQSETMGLDAFKTAAANLKLDTKKFNTCLDTGKYTQKIDDEATAGSAAGVEGTPGTFINGKFISGAVPYSQIKSMIDAALL